MNTVILTITVTQLLLLAGLAAGDKRLQDCLLHASLYHRATRQCWPPHERGPCAEDQWLAASEVSPGLGECGLVPPGDQAWKQEQEQLYTQVDIKDVTISTIYIYNVPTQAHCQKGELLVPDNFQADTQPCPALHSCVAWPRPADTARLANLVNPLQLEYIKAMVCGGEGEELACAPATNDESLFSAENLLQSLVAPPPACRPNPCPGGATPTLEEDGYYRCVPVVQHLIMDSLRTHERKCRRFEVRRACPDCPGGTKCVPRFRGNFRFNFKRSG